MNELKTGTGQILYEHARTLIPGGTQLLSKRPEMFDRKTRFLTVRFLNLSGSNRMSGMNAC